MAHRRRSGRGRHLFAPGRATHVLVPPPLPGLALALARRRGVDPARSDLVGTSPTRRSLATVHVDPSPAAAD